MNIPGLWETKGWPELDGAVWFRKEIFIDSVASEKSASLHLGSIGESDEAYINGIKVGETKDDPVTERAYTIPAKLLRKGRNVIAVRIEDKGGGGGFGDSPEKLTIDLGDSAMGLAGNWHYQIESVTKGGVAIYPDNYPTLLYNAMIHPLTQSNIKGVIWYQGESNTVRASQYRKAFSLMINDWRKKWGKEISLSCLFNCQILEWIIPRIKTKAPGQS